MRLSENELAGIFLLARSSVIYLFFWIFGFDCRCTMEKKEWNIKSVYKRLADTSILGCLTSFWFIRSWLVQYIYICRNHNRYLLIWCARSLCNIAMLVIPTNWDLYLFIEIRSEQTFPCNMIFNDVIYQRMWILFFLCSSLLLLLLFFVVPVTFLPFAFPLALLLPGPLIIVRVKISFFFRSNWYGVLPCIRARMVRWSMLK